MEEHIRRYGRYIHDDLLYVDIDKATYKEHLHKSFEWFACIKLSIQYKSIFRCWSDISPNIREEKCMPRDMGIDAYDIEGNRVAQMKLYNNRITWLHFATFLGCCYKFKDADKILYRNTESQLVPLIKSYIEDNTIIDHTIADIDFRNECKTIKESAYPINDKETEEIIIRDYQQEAIKCVENAKTNNKNAYICVPTGCGKTVIMLEYHKNNRDEILLVLVPRIVY